MGANHWKQLQLSSHFRAYFRTGSHKYMDFVHTFVHSFVLVLIVQFRTILHSCFVFNSCGRAVQPVFDCTVLSALSPPHTSRAPGAAVKTRRECWIRGLHEASN